MYLQIFTNAQAMEAHPLLSMATPKQTTKTVSSSCEITLHNRHLARSQRALADVDMHQKIFNFFKKKLAH
jgi:hypothetical protein